MKSEEISVTDAARNFADCVNRAHYQGVTFMLLKNGKPVARITPATERRCSGEQLAKILAQVKLPSSEARLWRKELKTARRALQRPIDKWQ
jgi:prevent-host-death family protein